MPMKYGSVMTVQPIPITEFGFPQPKPKVEHPWWEGWLTAFRVYLTVLEIGIAFIPGVGVAADIAVGLAAGAINQALDVASGSANVVGSLLNFAAPVIGGVFTGANNIRQVAKVVRGATELGDTVIAKGIQGISKFQKFNEGVKGAKNFVNKSLQEATESAISKSGLEITKEVTDAFKGINERVSNVFINEALQTAADRGLKISDNIAREAFEDERFTRVVRALTTNEEDYEFLITLLKQATNGRELREYLFAYVNSLDSIEGIEFLRTFKNQIDDLSKSVIAISPEHLESMVQFNNQISDALGGVIKSVEKDESVWSKINNFFSSKRGYDFVQRVQWIDPNDLGRAPVEWMYKKLRKRIRKAFAKIGKFAKAEEKVREAFARSGGIVVESQWHIGYKVVKKFNKTNLVQITYIQNAKTNALRHVIVMATDRQLKLYEASPGRMYRNTWALSTGKKIELGSMLNSIKGFKNPRALASVLGFIPVQALRNILSLISNIVENVDDMIKGDYLVTTKHWLTVWKSFRNTAVSRVFRLATSSFGDGFSKKYGKQIFRYVSKEIQRVNTNLVVKGIKNKMAGKDFMSGKLPNNFAHMFGISARSHTLRNLRKRNSGIPQMLTARRKLEIVKRLPNTVVPGRPFNGFRYR